MPKAKIHKYADELLLGKSYGEVHWAIDRPYLFLGSKHRSMFHSPKEAYIMGYFATLDAQGGLAGLLHVWLDVQCSKDKDFKKWLEFAAKQMKCGKRKCADGKSCKRNDPDDG